MLKYFADIIGINYVEHALVLIILHNSSYLLGYLQIAGDRKKVTITYCQFLRLLFVVFSRQIDSADQYAVKCFLT